uniref:G-protein coupled receptors family 1 profile domain-containing protein n=1 Tax=Ascaris lumbricoides TaxID=6252 RepID=A0A9J2Q7M4_ASCLU
MTEVCDGVEEKHFCRCLAQMCPIVHMNESREKLESCYMDFCFISKRALQDDSLMKITALYLIILFIGVIGNITTCIVIRKHCLLRTHSSRYLLNLAISDLVTLCVGLPFEIYMSWNQYPWSLPDFLCNLKAWIAETTSCISVMTILLFSIERYIAICHPILFLKLRDVRAQSWPFTNNGIPVVQSKMCMVAVFFDPSLGELFYILIHISFVLFFAAPLLIIFVLYALIALKVNHCPNAIRTSFVAERTNDERGYRITIILASVVTAFFCCYLPFQLQRLLFFYLKNDSQLLTKINQQIYFVSGFLFYFAPIINPFLYNVVSKRFRQAFKEVLFSNISSKYVRKHSIPPT